MNKNGSPNSQWYTVYTYVHNIRMFFKQEGRHLVDHDKFKVTHNLNPTEVEPNSTCNHVIPQKLQLLWIARPYTLQKKILKYLITKKLCNEKFSQCCFNFCLIYAKFADTKLKHCVVYKSILKYATTYFIKEIFFC